MNYLAQVGIMPQPPVGRRDKDKIKNLDEYWNQYINLLNKEIYKYEWTLPPTCDPRTAELQYIHYGCCLFGLKDETKELLTLQFNPSNIQTLYGYPLEGYGWALGFKQDFIVHVPGNSTDVSKSRGVNGIVGYANDLHWPTFFYLEQQAYRLAEVVRATDVALENMKTPYIVATDKNNLKTIKDAIADKRNNNDAILLSADILQNGELPLEIYPIATTPQVLDAMWQHYYNIEEETRTRQGLNGNPAPDKKERMITGEVEANETVTYVNDDIGLKNRKETCELINEIFADELNGFKCDVKSRFQEVQKEEYDDYERGEEDEMEV